MKQIIKVATITVVVLIGLVFAISQFYLKDYMRERADAQQKEHAEYEAHVAKNEARKSDVERYNAFVKGVKKYVLRNKVLPAFVSDIECNGQSKCAAGVKDGIYYLKLDVGVMAIKPVLQDGNVLFSCSVASDGFGCYQKFNTSMPELPKPEVDCGVTGNGVEALICGSDRLTKSQLLVESAYINKIKKQRSEIFYKHAKENYEAISGALYACVDKDCYSRSIDEHRLSNKLKALSEKKIIHDLMLTSDEISNAAREECVEPICAIKSMNEYMQGVNADFRKYEYSLDGNNKGFYQLPRNLEYINRDDEMSQISVANCNENVSGFDAVICDTQQLGLLAGKVVFIHRNMASLEADVATVGILQDRDEFMRGLAEKCRNSRCVDQLLLRQVLAISPNGLGKNGNIDGEHELIIVDSELETCIRASLAATRNSSTTIRRKHISALTSLKCAGKNISSLDGIEQLIQLRHLDLGHNAISDISRLAGLDLVSLDLNDNPVNDITPLAEVERLEDLDIRNTGVYDISPLMTAQNLKNLMLSDSNEYGCQELENLAGRTKLQIRGKRQISECREQ